MIRHEVLTAGKVPFRYRVAGLGSRFLAWLVDLFVIGGLDLMGLLVGAVLMTGRAGLGSALFIIWHFVVLWGYFLFFEWMWHGQTPGKALLGIRVIQWRGTEMNFFQAAVRNLLRVVDSLPLPLPLGPGLLVEYSPKSDPGAMRVSEAHQGQETNHETTQCGRDYPQAATSRGRPR
ncbi:MAG: RDD family protein, partial [Gemmataceae bacterium]